jgi:hypothetical protein
MKLLNYLNKRRGITVVALLLVMFFGFFLTIKNHNENNHSRVWMEYAMDVVREKKPSPPASARFYAYTASVYYDVLVVTNNKKQADLAAANIINDFYPDKIASSTEILGTLRVTSKMKLNEKAEIVLNSYMKRIELDIKQAKEPVRLRGYENWVGEKPLELSAGSWERWSTGSLVFDVPTPPMFRSKEYNITLLEVKKAANSRTLAQSAAINFWGGIPGTEAPAGIWQNRLYFVTKDLSLSDKEYAYAQKILSQAIADAFIECWKVKYTYWTKRPNMVDTTIDLAMPNPNFPSYVSGHSTISRAAAEVLSTMFPVYKSIWMADAEEAKNSRLWAGIHFSYDNEVGADLGRQVGENFIKGINLTKIR